LKNNISIIGPYWQLNDKFNLLLNGKEGDPIIEQVRNGENKPQAQLSRNG
jgi:hypothetical protein